MKLKSDTETAGMVEVLHQLLRDHVNMREILDLIDEQMAALGDAGAADFELLRTIMRYAQEYPTRVHERKEMLIYQRLIKRQRDAAATLRDLPAEHASLAELTKCVAAQLRRGGEADATRRQELARLAADYVRAYRRHLDMEELRFFPLALKHLHMSDWAEIDAAVTAPDDPVFGLAAQQPFLALRRQIMAARQSPAAADSAPR